MNDLKKLFEKEKMAFILIFISAIFIYLPTIGGLFLHTEDWFFSYWGEFGCPAVLHWVLPVGRPLQGLLFCLFPLVKKLEFVWIFRLVAVLNIALIGCLVWRWMTRWKIDGFIAFLVVLLTLTLPAFQVYSSFLITMGAGFSTTISILALFLVEASFSKKRRALVLQLRALAALLLVIALNLYQPNALYYVACLAIPVLMSDSKTFLKIWPKKLLTFASVLAIAMAVYYFVFRVSAVLFNYRDVGKYDGRNFVINYGERFRWFFTDPFFEAANLWSINPTPFIFWIVVSCMGGIAIWSNFQDPDKKGSLAKTAIALLFIPLGYGIHLMSSDPSKEYRTYAVLGSAIVFFLSIGLYSTLLKFSGRIKPFAYVLFSILAFSASISANKTVSEYFVFSDTAEYLFVKNEIRNYVASGKELKWINFVVARDPIGAPRQRNEIGEPVIRHTPDVEPLAWAALSQLGIKTRPKVTTSQSLSDPNWVELLFNHSNIEIIGQPRFPVQEGALVINLQSFQFK